MAMIVPLLLGSLAIPVRDRAFALQVQAETLGDIVYDPRGFAGVLHIYSDGTTIRSTNLSEVPSSAKWATFVPINFDGMELYYSRDGITTEKRMLTTGQLNDIPADVKWLTLSNFDGSFFENQPIDNQQYTYSVDGVNVLSGPEVPANALWATISYYTTTWSGENKALNYSRSQASYNLKTDLIRSVSIESHGADTGYALAGDNVTLSFTSLPALQSPSVMLAGQQVQATAIPNAALNEWRASVTLDASHPEGQIDFSIAYQDEGIPMTVSATTDGSSVFFDNSPPSISLTQSTSEWTQGNVIVNGRAYDTGSGVQIEKWVEGRQTESFFHNNGHLPQGGTFTAFNNGWYTWYASDRAGNETVQYIEIGNIDRASPTLSLTSSPTGWAVGSVQITASTADDLSGIKLTKWAAGSQPLAFFKNGAGTMFSDSFTVTDNGGYTVYAEDQAGNAVTEQITIDNLDAIPPVISLAPSTTEPTQTDIAITVDASDQESGIEIVKWAAGKQPYSYFAGEGSALRGTGFTVSENGLYTVYAKDKAGNEQIETVEITNIYKSGPSLRLSLDNANWTNSSVRIQLDVTDNGSGMALQKWAAGHHDPDYFMNEGTPFTGNSFAVDSNGMYTVYIKDNAGYEAVAVIEVTRMDNEKPIISELRLTPEAWTSQDVEIWVSGMDNSGVISLMKWSAGVQDEAYFEQGWGTVFQNVFMVDANGEYTVYAKDAAGNGNVKSLHVSNIDKEEPIIRLQPSIKDPTNQNVAVTADVYGTLSPIMVTKWAPGIQPLSYFDAEGNDFNGTFEAELNGWYTVYAESAAGNKRIETIEITNIFKSVPVIQVTVSPTVPTKKEVTVTASVYAPSPLVDRKFVFGQQDAAYFGVGGGEPWSDKLEVHENGWITYYVRDHAGNESVKQVEITNIDREKPVITLLGDSRISLMQGSDYTDPGATAIDNLDGDLTDRIEVEGKVDTSRPGQYTLRYSVADRAGNEAEEVVRTVNVTPWPGGGDTGPTDPTPGSGGSKPNPAPVDKGDQNEGLSGSISTPAPPPTTPAQGNDGDSSATQPPPSKQTPAFADISGHWAESEIQALYDLKLAKGYPDGSYKPDRPVTRAEFVALLVRSLGLEGQYSAAFEDIKNHWAGDAIRTALAHGIIGGYSSRAFGPDDPITREQMAVMLSKSSRLASLSSGESSKDMLSFKDQSSISIWAKQHVSNVVENELMNGYPGGRFLPRGLATRAEVTAVIHRFITAIEQSV
ncbi:S-layer homology domain-containing protein [Paenibacillus sp. FSL W7-1332]|uniref:S-layer homology domain-containing protein n=1 Tax=Paenibacillus sp. FSL W7-1332 TaxID=2921702 RepID=UPI0030CEEB4D